MSPTARSAARAVADLNDGVIIATVDIKAPIERVFRAITTPEEIVRWWGSPEVYTTTEWQQDALAKGARFVARGKGADGVPFSVEGEYLEVDPPHTLVHTWKPEWDQGKVTTVRYKLSPLPDGTRVTLRHDGFAGRPESCGHHAAGWELVLHWLGGFAAPEAPKGLFLCKLLAPRPTFPTDMTEAEGKLMQEHMTYWMPYIQDGTLLVFGPVFDPKGAWGMALVRCESAERARELANGDPIARAGIGFRYEVIAMPKTMIGRLEARAPSLTC